jgi:hypothetical protein
VARWMNFDDNFKREEVDFLEIDQKFDQSRFKLANALISDDSVLNCEEWKGKFCQISSQILSRKRYFDRTTVIGKDLFWTWSDVNEFRKT